MSWTIAEVRSVICPKCCAEKGQPCIYSGKGAVKAMRLGRSHQERVDVMVEQRRQSRPRRSMGVIDMDDK